MWSGSLLGGDWVPAGQSLARPAETAPKAQRKQSFVPDYDKHVALPARAVGAMAEQREYVDSLIAEAEEPTPEEAIARAEAILEKYKAKELEEKAYARLPPRKPSPPASPPQAEAEKSPLEKGH